MPYTGQHRKDAFKREIEMMRRVGSHPNVIAVLGATADSTGTRENERQREEERDRERERQNERERKRERERERERKIHANAVLGAQTPLVEYTHTHTRVSVCMDHGTVGV